MTNNTCPHCNTNLLGDLVIDYPLSQGKTMEEAIAYASSYEGWSKYGEDNRWDRTIALYDRDKDRVTAYRCPDCGKTWERKYD